MGFSKVTKDLKSKDAIARGTAVVNFMGNISYTLSPLESLKFIAASSIFGEPQYYRAGINSKPTICNYADNPISAEFLFDEYKGKNSAEVMEEAIDKALAYDFGGTLDLALELRRDYYMRLNPQIIMVRAAMMSDVRKVFTAENPKRFSEINMQVMSRADDVANQFAYWLYVNKTKNNLPNILKRSWKKRLETMDRYAVSKYATRSVGLIDIVRVSHANSDIINELMQKGSVEYTDNVKTWERERSAGKSWEEILETVNVGHMALLKNIRGIATELCDREKEKKVAEKLKSGVLKGKQFPFRYYSALKAIKGCNALSDSQKVFWSDTLEECIDMSLETLPTLKGNNVFLTDNSGSAWGTCTSEYGTVTVGLIDNLSSVIGAAKSDTGTVVRFGDKYKTYAISKREGILKQTEAMSKIESSDVGGSTEGGLFLYIMDAIKYKLVFDNIFIYSDMQAGHDALFCDDSVHETYKNSGLFTRRSSYWNFAKLMEKYRQEVNPKVNVYCVQTAGYNNSVLPEYMYRTAYLSGWTGKEILFADRMNKLWDSIEANAECNK